MNAHQLKVIRKEMGFSLHEMSDFLNVSYATVQRWEAGHSEPSYIYMQIYEHLNKEIMTRNVAEKNKFVKKLIDAASAAGMVAFLGMLFHSAYKSAQEGEETE